MFDETDVVIVGAGVVGLSAALGLATLGYQVSIIDKHPIQAQVEGIDKRVYAFNHASQQLFQTIGAWSHLNQSRLSAYQHMKVWDKVSRGEISFDARLIAKENLGHMVEESVLKEALLKALKTTSLVKFIESESVQTITPNALGVRVQGVNCEWQSTLLLVADGALSPCRDKLGITLTQWPYDQEAIVATVKTTRPHQGTAYQVFTSAGPLAFLPLSDPYMCSIVWSSTEGSALMAMAVDDFNQAITTTFEDTLGEVTVQGDRHIFPLVMRHADTYVGNHFALLGDAAHTVHPLAGLGLNIGLSDVSALLTLIKQHGLQSKRMLGAYQRSRKSEVWQMILVLQGLKAVFMNTATPVSTLRGLGMKTCQRLLPLKRFLIQQAAGV